METASCCSYLILDLAYCDAISHCFVPVVKHYFYSYPWHTQAARGAVEKCSHEHRQCSKPSSTLIPILILRCHSALRACSLKPGAVPSFVTFPFSISAAHSAAPTVFVNANRMLATGTNSSRTAATPKLTHDYQRTSPFSYFLKWCH